MELDWQIKSFSELSTGEFHDIIALRIKVFVVEQDCPYQELDGKDLTSYHIICRNTSGKVISTTRILPAGISYKEVSIGRVVIDESSRGIGVGHTLMEKSMDFIRSKFGAVPVRISAQKYLEKYYTTHKFTSTGKEYLEDGIPHVEMLYKPN